MDGLRRKLPSPGSLFVFEAAARHENFTRAAEELNVTQPAVSRALAGLEAHIGTRLFQRGRPGARLTEDGILLRDAVVAAFSRVEGALHAIETRRTGRAQVTLSVSTAFTTHWLMPRIARFQAAFPEVDLRFQLIPGPVTGPLGNVDIAMRFTPAGETAGRFIMQEAYVPVCAPGYAGHAATEDRTLILLEGDAPDRLQGLAGWHRQARDAQLLFSDYSVVVQAALVGQGIAAGWLNIVAHWIREGHLVPALPALARPGRDCRLLTRTGGPNATVVEAVADWLVAELRADLARIARDHPALGIDAILQQGSPA